MRSRDGLPRTQEFDVPTLIVHGDENRLPIGALGAAGSKLVKGATRRSTRGAARLGTTHRAQFNTDLLLS